MLECKLFELDIEFSKYPNGELYLEGDYYSRIKDAITGEYCIHWKYIDNESIIELMFFVEYLKQLGLFQDVVLNVRYLPYSRMDRIEDKHQNMFSLKYMANIINSLGFNKVCLNEIHSDVSLKLINNSYNYLYTDTLFNEFLNDNKLSVDKDNLTIMFPDKGAYNRYKDRYLNYNLVYGEKIRDFNSGEILGLQLKGSEKITKDVVIIDDLTSKGTTFIKSAEKLKEQGFKNIYLVVGHAEYTMLEGDLFNSNINTVYTTDSIIDISNDNIKKLMSYKKLKVTKLI